MREIRFTYNYEHYLGDPLDYVYNMSYIPDRPKATIDRGKKTLGTCPAEKFEELWDRISALNYSQILFENEHNLGCDGHRETLTLSSGSHEFSITLWCPSKEEYKKNCSWESVKLMEIIEDFFEVIEECRNKGE